MDIEVSTGEDRWRLTAKVQKAGEDLFILVTGGDRPHLGAVASATPRPSLADPNKTSATASVFCYVGHKEDRAAKVMSERIASATGVNVVVAAGMHWDGIKSAEIDQVNKNVDQLCTLLMQRLQGAFMPEDVYLSLEGLAFVEDPAGRMFRLDSDGGRVRIADEAVAADISMKGRIVGKDQALEIAADLSAFSVEDDF